MRRFLILWRRESLSDLRSLLTWSLAAAFGACTGALLLLKLYAADGTIQTLPTLYARVLAVTLPVLAAVATMRAFVEERQSGTLEQLLTCPVSEASVVFAKFAAAMTVIVLALAVSALGFVLYVETAQPPPVYSRTGIAVAMAVLVLHAAVWTAAGLLTSLVCRHQATAGILGLLVGLPHGLLAAGMAPVGQAATGYVDALSVAHVARGVLDTRPLVLCLSLAALLLFATVRMLESHRWKL